MSCGSYHCRVTILVQKGSTLELLMGTDSLAKLGFYLVKPNQIMEAVSLLGNPDYGPTL